MNIQDELKEALTRGTPLSVAECNAFLPRLDAEIVEAHDRLAPVHPGSADFNRGEEYGAALLSGSPEKVTEVRGRYERLLSEYDILQNYKDKVLKHRQVARTREAFEGLPKLQAELVAKLDRLDEVKRVLSEAVAEVDAAYTAVTQAHGDCAMGGMPGAGAGASEKTIQRVLAMHNFLGRRSDATRIKDDLHLDHLRQEAA